MEAKKKERGGKGRQSSIEDGSRSAADRATEKSRSARGKREKALGTQGKSSRTCCGHYSSGEKGNEITFTKRKKALRGGGERGAQSAQANAERVSPCVLNSFVLNWGEVKNASDPLLLQEEKNAQWLRVRGREKSNFSCREELFPLEDSTKIFTASGKYIGVLFLGQSERYVAVTPILPPTGKNSALKGIKSRQNRGPGKRAVERIKQRERTSFSRSSLGEKGALHHMGGGSSRGGEGEQTSGRKRRSSSTIEGRES